MKKVVSFVIIVSFILTGVCFAEAGKVGFISMKDILLNSDAGKDVALDLKKFVEERRPQIEKRKNVLEKLKTDLEKQRSVMTESAYKEKALSGEKEYRDFKRFFEGVKEEITLREQKLSQKLTHEVLKVVKTIGEREGYSCIIDLGIGAFAYYSKTNDITTKVIKEYNKVYNSGK